MNLPEEVKQVIYKLINPTTKNLEIFRGTNMDILNKSGYYLIIVLSHKSKYF